MSWVRKNSIVVKMVAYTGILFLLCTLMSAGIYWYAVEKAGKEEMERISGQTLSTINDGINSQIEYIHSYAVATVMGDNFQTMAGQVVNNPGSQIKIEGALYNITQFSKQVGATYFLDSSRKLYGVKRSGEVIGNQINREEIETFLENISHTGRWDVLPQTLYEDGISDISLVFEFQNKGDFRDLGTIIIGLDMDGFLDSYKDTIQKYSLDIQIADETGVIILPYRNDGELEANIVETKLVIENEGFVWEYTGKATIGIMDAAWAHSRILALLVLVIDSCVLFAGIYLIIRSFLRPLKRLAHAIDKTGGEELQKVNLRSNATEILRLQEAFNRMTERIEQLLEQTVIEQKNLRKMELSLLQAQINPHFLYNTLNDISALIVTDRKDEAYRVMKAFGSFYRRTLSKGKDIISLGEELRIVNDYLIVQKMRFESLFEVEQDIDERVLEIQVPKLMLQPLVENAIYHGFKSKGKKGTLKISAQLQSPDEAMVIVEDDGIGMSEEQVEKVLLGNCVTEEMQSFGLKKTIERICLYFGNNNCVRIESKQQSGTRIYIRITKLPS